MRRVVSSELRECIVIVQVPLHSVPTLDEPVLTIVVIGLMGICDNIAPDCRIWQLREPQRYKADPDIAGIGVSAPLGTRNQPYGDDTSSS